MPHKDPEKRKQYAREYYSRPDVRERTNGRNRAARAADPEAVRAKDRARHEANPDRTRANGRRWYEAHRDEVLEQMRDQYAADPQPKRQRNRISWLWTAHGLTPERFAEIWREQGGCCYLCARPLSDDLKRVHVDHDHSSCPPGRSCAACRRGLACMTCNNAIGLLEDDPDLMERVATALRAARAQARQRIAARPVQGELYALPSECAEGTVG